MIINIGILETQTLLRESFTFMLETHASNKVILSSNHYEDIHPVKDTLDIVLLDIPNFRRYREDASYRVLSKETKVIVLAQQGEENVVGEAMNAQVHGFLFKEMEADELLHAFQQILKGKIYIHGQATHHLVTFYQEQIEGRKQVDSIEVNTNPLPKRMFQTLQLASQGLSNKEIANKMRVSNKTVKNQMSHILIILHVQSRTAAIVKAVQQGWIVIPRL